MTRSYLRPTAFLDTPIGFDGQVARLAGGLLWHSAYELIEADGDRRVSKRLVPVSDAASLPDEVQPLIQRLAAPRPSLELGPRTIRFDQPQVAAILNMTPDSFSDGGTHLDGPEAAAEAGVRAAGEGAALIDVGGESTRPGAETVWHGDEIARVVPVIERLARAGIAVSIDTRKAEVMEAALAAGAAIVNDVSALLYDDRALDTVVRSGCPVILMHAGDPRNLHTRTLGPDPLLQVYDWLEARVAAVEAAGVPRARIIVDPGIGFGKSLADNLALLNGLALFQGLGCALMLGVSRKRMIGALSNEAPADRRLGGSVALAVSGAMLGAQILRVHDVPETVQALRVWRGLRDRALTGP
ncbi:dihydropteroate synthase [Sphingomonas changbaiensis NBRC 104936]|uniref:dihydropteroate synthase n=1 Tax=Sphingomonas changbaiensis NBRC 104936 TaxID=1219043 RepID=A0A0E9MNA2_9SPHN|nr:dihydropteroate synthase [Sphingomonas changbaiensis]GAO39014.1 dihydropteroate synthase [Sphingomonas changbaiensis NBRC 104936]